MYMCVRFLCSELCRRNRHLKKKIFKLRNIYYNKNVCWAYINNKSHNLMNVEYGTDLHYAVFLIFSLSRCNMMYAVLIDFTARAL